MSYAPYTPVPSYGAIVGGSRVIRLTAFAFTVIAVACVAISVLFVIVQLRDVNPHIEQKREAMNVYVRDHAAGKPADRYSLDSTSMREYERMEADLGAAKDRRTTVLMIGGAILGLGLCAEAVSALLRMVAWTALAVRDIAQNSFRPVGVGS
jgi:hypothetical protein